MHIFPSLLAWRDAGNGGRMERKQARWLNVTTDDGELLERIDLSEYDLAKPLARAALSYELAQLVTVDDERQEVKP